MFGFWAKAHGNGRTRFWMRKQAIRLWRACAKCLPRRSESGQPIGHRGHGLQLRPSASMRGRICRRCACRAGAGCSRPAASRAAAARSSKAELYAQLARIFSVRDDAIWNEYGMSELSSQAYARGRMACTTRRRGRAFWSSIRRRAAKFGSASKGSCAGSISPTSIRCWRCKRSISPSGRAQGFRLIGRLPRTEPRGCSLSAEDMVAAGKIQGQDGV